MYAPVVGQGLPHGKVDARGNDGKAENAPAQLDHGGQEGLGHVAVGFEEDPDSADNEQRPAKDQGKDGQLAGGLVIGGAAGADALDLQRANHEAKPCVGKEQGHGNGSAQNGDQDGQDRV